MTVTLRLAPESVAPRLMASPLLEATLSIHVLSLPKQHALQLPWVRACRDLSPQLRQELKAFRFFFSEGIANVFLDLRPDATFHGSLAQVAGTDSHVVRAIFDDYFCEEGTIRADADALALRELLLETPEGFLSRLVAMLDRYWVEAFAAEWARIEPSIWESVAKAETLLNSPGQGAFYAALRDQVRFDPRARTLTFARPIERTIDVTVRPITVVPSVYAWPHVMVTVDPDDPPVIIYPIASLVSERATDPPPPELMRLLRLLADDTRLLLLRLLAQRPHSTQELAALTYRSEPTVSRHLSQLADAGLVEARREGYYVVYEVRQDRLEPLSDALMGFIRAS